MVHGLSALGGTLLVLAAMGWPMPTCHVKEHAREELSVAVRREEDRHKPCNRPYTLLSPRLPCLNKMRTTSQSMYKATQHAPGLMQAR